MLEFITLALAQIGVSNPIPPVEEARREIINADAKLFWFAFEGCDAGQVGQFLTEDFSMLHDVAGLVAEDATSFLQRVEEDCIGRLPNGEREGYKNRRLVVPGSREFTALGDWGVLERGMHTFHELRQRPPGAYGPDDLGGPTWVQTGGARYINLWQWTPSEGSFRLKQSISIDHADGERYPPAF